MYWLALYLACTSACTYKKNPDNMFHQYIVIWVQCSDRQTTSTNVFACILTFVSIQCMTEKKT